MASACVVLDRTVAFRDHPLEAEPLGEEAPGLVGGNIAAPAPSRPRYLSLEEKEATIDEYLRAMIPDLQVVDPPGVSFLTMVRPHSRDPSIPQFGRHIKLGFAVAAHKRLVVMYARTPSSYSGCYLVLDFASPSPRSFTIPCTAYNGPTSYRCAGPGSTVITPLHPHGAFILVELLFCLHHPNVLSSTALCLWNSRGSRWEYKDADLAGQVPAQVRHPWRVHMSFPAFQSRENHLLCWVDLLHGLLLCDLHEALHSDLHMSFVPLPPNSCEAYNQGRPLNPQDFSTMACVDGTIKFFTMDGFVEGTGISLVTYTLDLDGSSPSWTKDTVLRLEDLWADETFISMGLPRVTPLFPILSTQEHDVVYLVIPSDVELIDGFRARRVQFQLSVDARKARIIAATQQNLPRTLFTSRYLIAFDADAQLGSKYHQRAVEAIGMGSSGKKIKLTSTTESESCEVEALDDLSSCRCVM